jgi:general secretion pathway protein G
MLNDRPGNKGPRVVPYIKETLQEKNMNIRERALSRIRFIRSEAASDRGFTLIEIMIVVTIIALLSAVIIVPNVTKYLKRAKIEACKLQIKNFQTPLLEYQSTKGNYPSTEEGLEALVKEGLLKKVPVDPWGNPYHYRYPGENDQEEYEIWSNGPDGKEGGEGANADIKSWEEK